MKLSMVPIESYVFHNDFQHDFQHDFQWKLTNYVLVVFSQRHRTPLKPLVSNSIEGCRRRRRRATNSTSLEVSVSVSASDGGGGTDRGDALFSVHSPVTAPFSARAWQRATRTAINPQERNLFS